MLWKRGVVVLSLQKKDEIAKKVEAILFVSGEPVNIKSMAEVLLIEEQDLALIIDEYAKELENDERGIKIIRLEDCYQMTSNQKYFEVIEKLFKKKTIPKLSEAVLETLAIICYNQPVTKSEITAIRGVNSDSSINRLLEYNIICEKGRALTPGRPILFGTTNEFLKYYGISSVSEFKNATELNLENFEEEAKKEVDTLSQIGDKKLVD